MNTLINNKEILAIAVEFTDTEMIVTLEDTRKISVPLNWYPLLQNATLEQRKNYRFIGGGIGIHFPEIDEDVLVETLLK